MAHKSSLTGLGTYHAKSWSVDNDANREEPHKDYPGKFYRREEVDELFKKLNDRQNFELRRADALEKFYMKELGYR